MVARRRDELWLSLLRPLTESFPRWAVWKNVTSAFAGTGDVDSFAPPEDWPAIEQTFIRWVAQRPELGPVLICRHIPQGPHFITAEEGSPYLVQLDVKERGTFRGSTLIDAWSLPPRSEIDGLGFRRVRPGVEGVIKLCMNGTRRGGTPDLEALRSKNVAALLASDPEGVLAGAELLGAAERPLIVGATAFLEGGWDRRAMLTVETWARLRAVAELPTAYSRWHFIKFVVPRCPLVSLIRDRNRRVDGDAAGWLRSISEGHELIEVGG